MLHEVKSAVVECVASVSNLRVKVLAIRDELKTKVFERDEPIDGAIIALLSKLNVFLLGKPGTGKSYFIKMLCSAIVGGEYFEYLLMKATKLEELFGPLQLSKLTEDRYIYNTLRRLPRAVIAFLDEIWKCSSATLNALLKCLNEHEFVNDGVNEPIPLQTCFSASNELPEDASLDALYDRFQLRYEVAYISDRANFRKLFTLSESPMQNTITLDELRQAQVEVAAVDVSDVPAMLDELSQKFVTAGFVFSDRRWRSAVKVLKAAAWIAGRDKVTFEDVEKLEALFWDRPEQRREIRKIVLSFASPDAQAAEAILDEARTVAEQAIKTATELRARGQKAYAAGGEANEKLNELKNRLAHFVPSRRRDEAIESIRQLTRDVQAKCLGI